MHNVLKCLQYVTCNAACQPVADAAVAATDAGQQVSGDAAAAVLCHADGGS